MFGGDEAKLYYVMEAVAYGVTPAEPAMLGIENVELIEPSVDPRNIKVRGCGSRDVNQIHRGMQNVSLKVNYDVPVDDIFQFAQYALNCYPLTVEVLYQKAVDHIVSLRHLGSRFNSLTVECNIEDVVKASAELYAQKLVAENSKVGFSYTDFGGSIPWDTCYLQKGLWDGSGLATNEEATDWKFEINNNLRRVPVIRSTNGHLLKFLNPRQRTLAGEVTFEFEHKTQFFEVTTDAEFSLKFGLGPKYVLFTGCKWDRVSAPTRFDDLVSATLPFTAKSVEFEGVT